MTVVVVIGIIAMCALIGGICGATCDCSFATTFSASTPAQQTKKLSLQDATLPVPNQFDKLNKANPPKACESHEKRRDVLESVQNTQPVIAKPLTIGERVVNTIVGTLIGAMAGGAIVMGIGVGAGIVAGFAATSVGAATQIFAIGALGFNSGGILASIFSGIEPQLVEYP